MKLERGSADCKYILDDKGEKIGSALKLSNGRWAPFTHDEKTRLVVTHINFKSPKYVLKFFEMNAEGRS